MCSCENACTKYERDKHRGLSVSARFLDVPDLSGSYSVSLGARVIYWHACLFAKCRHPLSGVCRSLTDCIVGLRVSAGHCDYKASIDQVLLCTQTASVPSTLQCHRHARGLTLQCMHTRTYARTHKCMHPGPTMHRELRNLLSGHE